MSHGANEEEGEPDRDTVSLSTFRTSDGEHGYSALTAPRCNVDDVVDKTHKLPNLKARSIALGGG